MEIIPFVGDQQLTATSVTIRVNPADRARAEELVERTAQCRLVNDTPSFERARTLAGEAKAMLKEIEDSKKLAKKPFNSVEKAIDKLAAEVALEVSSEHERILILLNAYVRKLETERAAEERARAEAARLEREAHDRKVREAEAAKRAAELAARQAQDEAAKLRLEQEALKNALLVEQQKLAREMAEELAMIGEDQPKKGLVPGGRVDHPYTFKLMNLPELINNHRLDLLRWELNVRACQDDVRLQLERNPDAKPVLPGIEISQEISVSVRATRR